MRMKVNKISQDERGQIYEISFGDKRFLMIETLADHSRGGDVHKHVRTHHMISGLMEVRLIRDGKELVLTIKDGEKMIINPGEPHIFTALENSLMIETQEGYPDSEYYPPYRSLVR